MLTKRGHSFKKKYKKKEIKKIKVTNIDKIYKIIKNAKDQLYYLVVELDIVML